MTDGIRAISLWQPWASAVSWGLKTHDTRSWGTSYRGPLLIHAARRWTAAERGFWERTAVAAMESAGPEGLACSQVHGYGGFRPPLGCIVAVADVVGVHDAGRLHARWSAEGSHRLDRLLGDYSPGRFAWELEGVRPLPDPLPCGGMQGLWTPTAAIVAAVRERLATPGRRGVVGAEP